MAIPQVHPLDGYERITDKGAGTWKYFLKVVPTTYTSAWGESAHRYHHAAHWCPPACTLLADPWHQGTMRTLFGRQAVASKIQSLCVCWLIVTLWTPRT